MSPPSPRCPFPRSEPNPQQPRHEFDEASLKELADSIREKGVLQPILAEADKDGAYIIIAGERRVRAARLAGLQKIPVVVRQFSRQEKLEIALIENVQRDDLTPIEEALAYRRLMEMADLSQEQIAVKVGKDRSTIANTLRLLKLPEDARDALSRGAISAGHARALLMLVNPSDQQVLLRRIVERGSRYARRRRWRRALNGGKKGAAKTGDRPLGDPPRKGNPSFASSSRSSSRSWAQRSRSAARAKKGRIEISFFSPRSWKRILLRDHLVLTSG